MTILLLAGTREARELSFALEGQPLVSSLAGATQRPARLGGDLRIGGFGGVAGLKAYLIANKISMVVDATHPFADQMSRNAALACGDTGVHLLQLVRPAWEVRPQWQMVPDLATAAQVLETGAHVFLATGRGSLDAFKKRKNVEFTARVIDDLPGRFPLRHGRFLVSHPPFSVADEIQTLHSLEVDTLVSRNSGGSGGVEKLEAAEQLGLRIVMVQRPDLPDVDRVSSVEDAIKYIGKTIG